MSKINELEQGMITNVRIKLSADGSLQIAPLDQSEKSRQTFQALADEVIAEARALGRSVMQHSSDRFTGYDFVVIYPTS